MKTFLVIALHEKEKTCRIALNSTEHIEEIGELEGKKGHTPCFGGDLSLLKPSYVKHELCQISLYFCRRGASFRLSKSKLLGQKICCLRITTWDKSLRKGKTIAKLVVKIKATENLPEMQTIKGINSMRAAEDRFVIGP